jgi:ABC-type branched-subunit amino acid transport system substrate-binding protein
MARRRCTWKGGRRVGAAAVLLALVAVGCGNSGSSGGSAAPTTTAGSGGDKTVSITGVPGVTDKEISYAVIGTKANNPLGTCILDCYQQGIHAYFDYRNSQGGIYGRKLVVGKEIDDELSQNQVRALEVTSSNAYFGDFNATLLASGWGDLDKAGVPTYVWGINFAEATGRPAIFGSVATSCSTCSTRAVPYAAKVVKAKRVASLGYGISQNSKLCAKAVADSVDRYGPQTGEKAVYVNDNLDFGLPNGIGPEVTAMKKAGVDFISTCIDLNGMKTLAQELQRQGMQDVTLYHPNTYNQSFVKEAGPLFEGDIVSVSFRPFEATPTGGLKAYLTWMKKDGNQLSELAMVGWLNADEAYQGLKAAGPNFDRAKVIAATNKMTAYTADGLLNPIDWSRQHNPPTQDDPATNGYKQDCVAMVRVVHGEFQTVAPKDKPFLCWSNADRNWSEPVPTSFR